MFSNHNLFIASTPSPQVNPKKCPPLSSSCLQPLHFFDDNTPFKNASLSWIWLASFPGSGNTWMRSVIEEGSRIYSGSVYRDPELYKDGFIGGFVDAFAKNHTEVSVIKTHDFDFDASKFVLNPKAGIFLVRNLFEATLSTFNLGAAQGHTKTATAEKIQKDLPQQILNEIPAWTARLESWVGLPFNPNNPKELRLEPNWHKRTTDVLIRPTGHPVLVVFYEDLIQHFPQQIKRIFNFLESIWGPAVLKSSEAQRCVYHHLQKTLRQQRSHQPVVDPVFFDPAIRNAMKQACEQIKHLWVEEKWGPCGEVFFQSERNLPKTPLPDCVEQDEDVVP